MRKPSRTLDILLVIAGLGLVYAASQFVRVIYIALVNLKII